MIQNNAIFMGNVLKLRYRYGFTGMSNYMKIHTHCDIDNEEIQKNVFTDNPLKTNDEVYLDSINKVVNITKVIRDSSGGYIYYTDHEIKVIEDEETKKSLEKARGEELEDKEQMKLRYSQCYVQENKTKEIESNKSNKWYKFWK